MSSGLGLVDAFEKVYEIIGLLTDKVKDVLVKQQEDYEHLQAEVTSLKSRVDKLEACIKDKV